MIRARVTAALVVITIVAVILFVLPENAIYLSSRGLVIPAFVPTDSFPVWLAFVGLGGLAAAFAWYVQSRRERHIEISAHPGRYATVIFLLFVVIGWVVIGDAPFVFDMPVPQIAVDGTGTEIIRRITGGETISPEYAAIVTGLALYTAAFISEIVRAGIQAVPHGQTEAALAVGLTKPQTLRMIILPQALRVIIPPLGNQYLNLTKNSSLATAIAFADLFAISKIVMHQSGQEVVMIVSVMLTYLAASLSISAVMNWVNRRMSL
jgi:general L-amino acid transport system permease protein